MAQCSTSNLLIPRTNPAKPQKNHDSPRAAAPAASESPHVGTTHRDWSVAAAPTDNNQSGNHRAARATHLYGQTLQCTAQHSTGLLHLPVPHVMQPAPVPVYVSPCPASRRPHHTHAPRPCPARVSAAAARATRPDLRHCRLHTALKAAAAAAVDRHRTAGSRAQANLSQQEREPAGANIDG